MIETGGNLAIRRKLILRVKPQEALIRMGGYYEIKVTGAAIFDRPFPEGGDALPQDTGLIRQGGVHLIAPGK